jgi:dipeptidase D
MYDSGPSFLPRSLHDYFIGITQRPHPSANQKGVVGNEDPVRAYVVAEARKLSGVSVAFYEEKATEPGERVIVLSRPGAARYAAANKPPVILQAHMDMVYNPVDMAFPLNVVVDGARADGVWIRAREKGDRNSTLGADDGIGVATALAILADPDLKDYPLECLFTVQEETDMGGAQNCDLSHLSGATLLNLDAEDLKVIIYGSAGGSESTFSMKAKRSTETAPYAFIKVSIFGLRGGHSGVDINKGRANAIKLLSQALVRLNKRIYKLGVDAPIRSYDLCLCDLKRGDVIKANAIPTKAEAVVAVAPEHLKSFILDFKDLCGTLKEQAQPVESGFSFEAVECELSTPLDRGSTDAVLCAIAQISTGVIAMKPELPGIVETSSNFFEVEIKDCDVTLGVSNRSSRDAALDALEAAQSAIAHIFDFTVKTGINRYPSWQPNEDSSVLNVAKRVYQRRYGQSDPTVIHAGLECGTLASRMAEMDRKLDCVSIGPTIENPHTPNESLQVASADRTQTVEQFYNCVSDIVKELFDPKG